MNLFGRKKTAPTAAAAAAAPAMQPSDAVNNLAKQQETLTKRQEYLEKQMQTLAVQAVERNKKGDKRGGCEHTLNCSQGSCRECCATAQSQRSTPLRARPAINTMQGP